MLLLLSLMKIALVPGNKKIKITGSALNLQIDVEQLLTDTLNN